MQTIVELVGVNGERFTLAGPDAGDQGVYLGTGITGLYEPPVKAMYEEPGNYPGARYLNHRVLRRDVVFAVHILNDKGAGSWLSRDSEWRKAWAFDRDSYLYVTTEESGTRYLKLRLFESPEVSTDTDPNGKTVNTVKMVTVAGDPFWYEDDAVYSATTQTNTTFDPAPLPWPWPQPALPTEELSITVPVCNPTDQYIFPKWTVPGSTYAPAEPYIPGVPWLGAPASRGTIWTLPDYSFEDESLATRRVRLPALIGGLRTDEVQCFNLDGVVTGGTFNIKFGTEQTTNLAYNASTGQVKAALEALASVAYDDVEVTRGKVTNEVQVLEMYGATGGTFTLTFGGQTTTPLPFNASDAEIRNALRALGTVGAMSVDVKSKVTNEVQVIKVTGEPTGGTFKLCFDGSWTNDIPWNANAFQVWDALTGIGPIDANDIQVNQEWFKPYAPWYVTFARVNPFAAGLYEGVNVPSITADPEGLTGGAGMDVVVSTETQGSRPYVITFKGSRAGQNLPELTINTSGLTGNVAPTAMIRTNTPGAYPYQIKFRNNLSGQNFPLLEIVTSGLSGADIGYRSWKLVEGNTAPAENCVVDSDPRVEQIASESGSAVWSRMNGVRFRHPIPPWTGSKTFQVTVSGCVPGQMVTLRLPRPWSRPWGLE